LFQTTAPASQPCLSYASILQYVCVIVFKLAYVLANKQATATFLIRG